MSGKLNVPHRAKRYMSKINDKVIKVKDNLCQIEKGGAKSGFLDEGGPIIQPIGLNDLKFCMQRLSWVTI